MSTQGKLSLSQPPETLFPWAVISGGQEYSINADFRVILKILRMYSDPRISTFRKPALACKWFFADEMPTDAFAVLQDWMNPAGKSGGENYDQERQYDFEADAEEIYTSFLSQYRIDLLTVTRLHWRQFLILFNNLDPDTAFRRKIRLRFLDLDKAKDDDGSLRRAKEAIQLEPVLSRDELIAERRFEREWGGADGS